MSILLLLFSITVLHVLGNFIEQLVWKRRNLPPSPFALPILGHLHLLKDPLHEALSTISSSPITLLYFGRKRVLHVTSPVVAEDCLRHNDSVFANRPRLLTGDIFGYGCTTLIWAPYGELWRALRRISIVQILGPHQVQLSSEIRSEEMRSLICRVICESSETVEVGLALFETAQSVMMRVLVKEGYDREESKRFREIMEEVMRVEGTSTTLDVLPWLRFLGFQGRLKEKFRVLAEVKEKFLDDLLDKNREKVKEVNSDNSPSRMGTMEKHWLRFCCCCRNRNLKFIQIT